MMMYLKRYEYDMFQNLELLRSWMLLIVWLARGIADTTCLLAGDEQENKNKQRHEARYASSRWNEVRAAAPPIQPARNHKEHIYC